MRNIFLLLAVITLACCNNKKTESSATKSNENFLPVNPDSVQFSFVFMGCNRINAPDTLNPNTNASTANVPELQRTFNEIAALNPKPVFYFFLGDEVLGLTADTNKLKAELQAWRNQYEDKTFSSLPASGIQLVAIPGNHEMLYEKNGHEVPNKGVINVFMNEMSSYMPTGVSINRVVGKDSLDNQMTYSFNWGNTHFILLNTDTYTKEDTMGMAPAGWISNDIIAARKNNSVKHIFILGHKPALVDSALYIPDGDKNMDVSVVKKIWPVMEANQVEAMLSAHSHQYDRLQPDSGKTYQVIAGNGGSSYEHKAAKHKDRQFLGYTIVYIMKNGQVILQSMGRSVLAENYLDSIPASLPTSIRDQVNISWGTNAGMWEPVKVKEKK